MFELHTKGMTPRERRDWWNRNPIGGPDGYRGPTDLGIELESDKRHKWVERVSDQKKEFIDEPLDSWYNTGSVTSGIARATVSRYNVVRGVKE